MTKNINIEKALFPKSGKLNKNGTAIIIDAELDPLKCTFNGDDSVVISTKDYTYITLSSDNLLMMLDMINETN